MRSRKRSTLASRQASAISRSTSSRPTPNERLAYISYYAGGLRVVSFGEQGLQEVGAFIDEGGNNFWGVEFAHIAGTDYVATSDRDFGLYLFKYTGPHPGR